MSAKSSYAEIRKYEVPPPEKPLRVIMCLLYLIGAITEKQFKEGLSVECDPNYDRYDPDYVLTEQAKWNYIRRYIDFQFVTSITV